MSETVQAAIVTLVAIGALFTLVRPLLPGRQARPSGSASVPVADPACTTCHCDAPAPTARRD